GSTMRNVTNNVPLSGEIWQNWPITYSGPPAKFEPASVSDLVAITRMAGIAGHRASGSHWSSSAAALAAGIWTDTNRLRRVLACGMADIADELPDSIDANNLILVQSGIKLHELAWQLWARGFSLPTLGGALGQSLAGAISTSTHGSDIELPPLPGMVRAIHLVSPTGQEFWLEHPDRRI